MLLLNISIDNFIEKVLDNSIEYDDEFSNILEEISLDKNLQVQFISAFNGIEKKLNMENVNYALSLAMELAVNHRIDLKVLYPLFLRIMFHEYCLDYSLCYRFCKLLIHMRDGNKEIVFKDILNNIKQGNLVTARISVCSLYGNFDFNIFEKGLTNSFLDKILTVLEINYDDVGLKNDIKNFLLPRINNEKYLSYYEQFTCRLQ